MGSMSFWFNLLFDRQSIVDSTIKTLKEDPEIQSSLDRLWMTAYSCALKVFAGQIDCGNVKTMQELYDYIDQYLEDQSQTYYVYKLYRNPNYWICLLANYYDWVKRPWSLGEHLDYISKAEAEYSVKYTSQLRIIMNEHFGR